MQHETLNDHTSFDEFTREYYFDIIFSNELSWILWNFYTNNFKFDSQSKMFLVFYVWFCFCECFWINERALVVNALMIMWKMCKTISFAGCIRILDCFVIVQRKHSIQISKNTRRVNMGTPGGSKEVSLFYKIKNSKIQN